MTRSWVLLAAAFVAPGLHAAELSQADLGSHGAMISTCGGLATGSFPIEGGLFDWGPGLSSCSSALTTLSGVVLSASDGYFSASPSVSTEAQGTAQMGRVGLQAHFRAIASAGFAAASATGGWTDTWTLNPVNPALIGQNAVLSFSLHLDGVLEGLPTGNSYTRIGVQTWLNNSPGSQPRLRYQGQGQGGFPFNKVVDETLVFDVNVKLGEPFELGIFARASVGTAGAGPSWFSEATSAFGNTLSWRGIQALTVGGEAVAYSLSTVSGVDWTMPVAAPVPEPATLGLMGLGLLGLLLRRSGRQG